LPLPYLIFKIMARKAGFLMYLEYYLPNKRR
jgi:hypothetical protein